MSAAAALLSLCFGAQLMPCPNAAGPQCTGELASGQFTPTRVAVSPDDTFAALATTSGLQVFTVTTTGAAFTLSPNAAFKQLALSPDGGKVVAVRYDGISVVTLSDKTELWSVGSRDCVSVAYSPDGNRIASGHLAFGDSAIIQIWNAGTGDLELNLTGGHTHSVYGLAYTLDGGRIISGSFDSKVVVWNATTGAILKTLTDHIGSVLAIKVSPDGLYFASVGQYSNDAVNIYKLSDYSMHKNLRNGRGSRVLDLSFSQDWSKMVVVGSGDMEVYSVETGNLLQAYTMLSEDTHAVSYFHTSDTIITGEGHWHKGNGRILLWDDLAPTPPPTPAPATPAPSLSACPSAAGPECTAELAKGLRYPQVIAVSQDDTLAAVTATNGLYVYKTATGAAVTVPNYARDAPKSVAFSPDASRAAVALGLGGVAVVDLSSGTELWWSPRGHYCQTVVYSPDGTHIASGHSSGNYSSEISIWNAETGNLVLSFAAGYARWIRGLAYTLDGGRILSATRDSKVAVWSATTGDLLKTLDDRVQVDHAIHVSPDGLYFAAIAESRTVNIYKLSDYSLHKKINNVVVDNSAPVEVSFSQDWSKLVVTGYNVMGVYSVATGNLLQSHALPFPAATAISYFHISDTIITGEGNTNGSILLWDDVAPRVCTDDDACRLFGDTAANCTTSRHCDCGTHSGALCEVPAAGPAPVDVHVSVAVTLPVPCHRAGTQALLGTLRAAATARGAQDVSVGASCGTLSVAVSGVVSNATVATTADTLVDALGAAVVAHSNFTNIAHASRLDPFVQPARTTDGNLTAECTQDALTTVKLDDGRCLVLTCNDGFVLSVDTRDGKDYHTCAGTPAPDTPVPQPAVTPAPDADDDLSDGAIAGIVVGCVAAVAVLILLLVFCVRRAPDAAEQEQQPKQQQPQQEMQHAQRRNSEPAEV